MTDRLFSLKLKSLFDFGRGLKPDEFCQKKPAASFPGYAVCVCGWEPAQSIFRRRGKELGVGWRRGRQNSGNIAGCEERGLGKNERGRSTEERPQFPNWNWARFHFGKW